MNPSAFKRRRLAMNMTQTTLGAALGVSRSNIARYENGKIPISPAIAILLKLISERNPWERTPKK